MAGKFLACACTGCGVESAIGGHDGKEGAKREVRNGVVAIESYGRSLALRRVRREENGVTKRGTLTIPTKPIAQTVAAEAKYTERSPQTILTPSTLQLIPEPSHSLSGIHLSDLQAPRTCMVTTRFVMAPKRVITMEASLL